MTNAWRILNYRQLIKMTGDSGALEALKCLQTGDMLKHTKICSHMTLFS